VNPAALPPDHDSRTSFAPDGPAVGVCSWAFTGAVRGTRPLRELGEAARRAGFVALEGAFYSRHGLPAADGLLPVPVPTLATLELHRSFLTDERPERQEHALAIVRRMVACAADQGMASLSFSPGPPGGDGSRVLDRLAENLEPLLDQAERRGVVIALENLPGSVVADRSAMAAVLARLPRLGLCLDVGNAVVSPPVAAWLDELGGRAVKIHLSDGVWDGGAFQPRAPGAGAVPWAAIRERLLAMSAPLFVEAQLPAGGDETAFLAALHRQTREVLAC
jgi:sugar phosphate isomerase/epimerase